MTSSGDEAGVAARACDQCLARGWLLARLASHLEAERRRILPILALGDEELIESVGGRRREAILAGLRSFDGSSARARCETVGVEPICRCDGAYPRSLRDLAAPPAVLYVAGGLERLLGLAGAESVAIVGARKASGYGLEVARSLARGLGAAGVCVVSGLAFGIDSAAHAATLEAGGATVAVMPGPADDPYPPSKRALHARIREAGAAVSELPPGTPVWRWMFPARNRIIAALASLTVVVEARRRSGALLTAAAARGLGRTVAAVPGSVTSPLAAGPNALLAEGAKLVSGPQEILDHLFGAGMRRALAERRPPLEPPLAALLDALAAAPDTPAALSRAGLRAGEGLAALASLEIAGYVRRAPGGRFVVVP